MDAKILIAIFSVLVASIQTTGANFCPNKLATYCYERIDECCSEYDCPRGKICCEENCGFKCTVPDRYPSDTGVPVDNPPDCSIHPKYCPAKTNTRCSDYYNQCCQDTDCPASQICCQENCGNTCKDADWYPSRDGVHVTPTPECQIGPVDGQNEYCPPTSSDICITANHKCCGDFHCFGDTICCSENCGNECKPPTNFKSNGTRVELDVTCLNTI